MQPSLNTAIQSSPHQENPNSALPLPPPPPSSGPRLAAASVLHPPVVTASHLRCSGDRPSCLVWPPRAPPSQRVAGLRRRCSGSTSTPPPCFPSPRRRTPPPHPLLVPRPAAPSAPPLQRVAGPHRRCSGSTSTPFPLLPRTATRTRTFEPSATVSEFSPLPFALPAAASPLHRLLPYRPRVTRPESRDLGEREGERMVKGKPKSRPANAPAEVVFDPSASGTRKPRRVGAPSSGSEWHNFMGSSLSDMYRKPVSEKATNMSDDEPDIDIARLLKDVELFGASTWKERKQIENRKVVELGGKAIKKHRTPLSVAKPAMKNKNKREQRKIEEERLLGIFRKRDTKNGKAQKTRPEDQVLRATEGRFKNGILDVKHLLAPPKPSGRDVPEQKMRNGKKKGKGKQKGGRRKRR